MFHKIFFTSCIALSFIICVDSIFAAWSCAIDSGPIPELAQYSRSIDTEINRIKNSLPPGSNCGISKNGASSSVQRTIETIDMAFLEIPIFDNTFLDFAYTIKLAVNGDARTPVVQQGAIFNQIEQKITAAITSVSNSCNLNSSVKDEFKTLLQQNQALENVYKQAALWVPSEPTGLSDPNLLVARAINVAYVPTATAACEGNSGIDDPIEKIVSAIENLWKYNDSVFADWKKGIALLQWGGSKQSIQERNNQIRRLLQNELSRQWLSPRMIATIMGNYDCVKAKTAWDDSLLASVNAKAGCLSNPILGTENLLKLPWKTNALQAPTLDKRIYAVDRLVKESNLKNSILKMDSLMRYKNSSEIEIKSKLMLDIVDLHISILATTRSIEKRIPKMRINCMKWQINIKCQF